MEENKEEKKHINEKNLDVELSENVVEGVFSNLTVITHSKSEFIIDFIRIMPGMPKGRVKSRVILTPDHAKRFLAALGDNIEKYENNVSPISENNVETEIPIDVFKTSGKA